MAMLAGPRRKQKVINLRAKNSAWSNDSTKFGQKMLEKMGWSAGKGLGAKENGIVEHVVAKYKNDDKGLGYDDKNDQWTKHEDDFNALLANLSSGDTNDEKLHSGISLEDKSKKSKARVHYHKFTRGKDLTKYSEKDLANIFGKKSLKEEKKPEEVLKDETEKTTEQVFTEKGSMEDYFKNKLAAFKSQTKLNISNLVEKDENDADYNFQGFSGTNDTEPENHQGFGFQSFSFYNTDVNGDSKEETIITEDSILVDITKKRKKKKKDKLQDEELLIEDLLNEECIDDEDKSDVCPMSNENSNTEEKHIKIKKKKRKKEEQEELLVTMKKSKKKRKQINEDHEITEIKNEDENVVEESHVPKKKKKRKNIITEN